jgi:Double zinc ribbon
MEFKTDEANLRADSNQTGELNLYDELVAFSNLSPEEQKTEQATRFARASEPTSQSTDGFIFADLVDPGEPAFAPVEEREIQSFEPAEQPSFELMDRAELQAVKEPSTSPLEDFSFELSDDPARGMKPESSSERLQADHSGDADLDLAYLLRVTGPLLALGLTMNATSSLLVCGDCRSQSSSDDMFCVTCGGLLYEAELPVTTVEAAASGLTCEGCDYLIEEDEIFCPSCGTVI